MKTQKPKLKKFDRLINELAGEYYIITVPVNSLLDWRTGVSLIRKRDLREMNFVIYDEIVGVSVEIDKQYHFFKSYRRAMEFIKTL